MVHNGIEYGMMAAYAEGLNVLHHANAGKQSEEHSAETTPMDQPQYYMYDLDIGKVSEVWRRGSVVASWLVGAAAEHHCSWPIAMVTPMPASMPCTIAGLMASAARATRGRTEGELHEAREDGDRAGGAPAVALDEVGGDHQEAGGAPLIWSGAPPSSPATMPPTTAATRPAWGGAPVARAMPSDSGTASRKTTIEAERSRRTAVRRVPFAGFGPGLPAGLGGQSECCGVCCGCGRDFSIWDIPVSSGATRSRGARSWAAVYCGGTRADRVGRRGT